MRRKNVQNIQEIIGEIIGQNHHLNRGLLESKIVQNWPVVMGPAVARYSRNVYFYKGILFVELTSSVVKSELLMLKDKIIESLNKSVGTSIVTDVIFK